MSALSSAPPETPPPKLVASPAPPPTTGATTGAASSLIQGSPLAQGSPLVQGEDQDFGLSRIAFALGKGPALLQLRRAQRAESGGDYLTAAAIYRAAYRLWPALDSVLSGGVPLFVRAEAAGAGLRCDLHTVVDVGEAQRSRAVLAKGLLTAGDIEAVARCERGVAAAGAENEQNRTHHRKRCVFLNEPPARALRRSAPEVLDKIQAHGVAACEREGWRRPGGPLRTLEGGIEALSFRVVEHWTYQEGGGLVDLKHNDTDSICTFVAMLSGGGEFEGGVFCTAEAGGENKEHPLAQGDVLCLLSHKYHNVKVVTRGVRRYATRPA